jgi:hypothetical protein
VAHKDDGPRNFVFAYGLVDYGVEIGRALEILREGQCAGERSQQ